MSDFRRPGVYLEEQLQTQPNQSGSAVAVAVFIGVTAKGDAGVPVRVDSWSDFVQKFGGFGDIPVKDASVVSKLKSFLPYGVFAYYQNGGRACYVIRVLPLSTSQQGATAKVDIMDTEATPKAVFTVSANGPGAWGNDISVNINEQSPAATSGSMVFSLTVYEGTTLVETFNNLSVGGVQGTRPAVYAINDPLAGSRYLTAIAPTAPNNNDPDTDSWPLVGGVDPGTPGQSDLTTTAVTGAVSSIEGPLLVCFEPFTKADGTIVMPSAQSFSWNDGRNDIFTIWDGDPIQSAGSSYANTAITKGGAIGTSESFAALYVPWVITPDPAAMGATISVPPSGSVAGVMSRIDGSIGPWRTPAGLPAVLSTAVATEVKFTDTDQGNMNFNQVNVIRSVPGSGICIMGARTRKLYGPDRYVGARRTLIYIEDRLRYSTQFAVFQSNDSLLWGALRSTARNILQPIWENGGLAGGTADDAFYIVCDGIINTPQVVQSGEVRMEVGVALQYPAEFVVIRVTQFDSGASVASELVPAGASA